MIDFLTDNSIFGLISSINVNNTSYVLVLMSISPLTIALMNFNFNFISDNTLFNLEISISICFLDCFSLNSTQSSSKSFLLVYSLSFPFSSITVRFSTIEVLILKYVKGSLSIFSQSELLTIILNLNVSVHSSTKSTILLVSINFCRIS